MEKGQGNQKSSVRRDTLIKNEREAQKIWADLKMNESNPIKDKKKYMITFPYPYMNGRIHVGHVFSLLKSEFMARYKRVRGFNVLFPFGFHCTGMPICAAALRLKEEIQVKGMEAVHLLIAERAAAVAAKVVELPKITQYEIMVNLGVPKDQIPSFSEPEHWLTYFPDLAKEDLTNFGINVDWRRSFITTSANPYYDSFIRWQFTKLKEAEFIKFGTRPSIFSIKDDQMCADHDRSEGEGVNPQEYTLIKIQLLELPESLASLSDKSVFLVAATLRPETMYGQTNCFVLPEGEYGAYEARDGSVYVCSERSALNMAY